ncbi:MAG: hypothetical protein DWG83_01565 [Chloroflexi bacterium]|nr:hypothetical protein [Chloroflexota bacterium]
MEGPSVNGFWAGAGVVQQLAIAAASASNAVYFALRLRSASGPRRLAAGLMTLLFVGIAVEAIANTPVSAVAADVLRRMPLLLATTGIAYLVGYRSHARTGQRTRRSIGGAQ